MIFTEKYYRDKNDRRNRRIRSLRNIFLKSLVVFFIIQLFISIDFKTSLSYEKKIEILNQIVNCNKEVNNYEYSANKESITINKFGNWKAYREESGVVSFDEFEMVITSKDTKCVPDSLKLENKVNWVKIESSDAIFVKDHLLKIVVNDNVKTSELQNYNLVKKNMLPYAISNEYIEFISNNINEFNLRNSSKGYVFIISKKYSSNKDLAINSIILRSLNTNYTLLVKELENSSYIKNLEVEIIFDKKTKYLKTAKIILEYNNGEEDSISNDFVLTSEMWFDKINKISDINEYYK